MWGTKTNNGLKWLLVLTLSTMSALLLGCQTGNDDDDDDDDTGTTVKYSATIKTTSYGIPHITAEDYGSLGFGQGYVLAKNALCVMADQIVKVRSERSKYFGAGDDNTNIDSDFGYLNLQTYARAETAFSEQIQDVQDLINGTVAGYNQYLADTGKENLPSECQNADWVNPISSTDLFAYYLDLITVSASWQLIGSIGEAQPPTPTERTLNSDSVPDFSNFRLNKGASNGIAVGKDATDTGKGMVLSNTHLNWEGELTYLESHLTIPGEVNVSGVSLLGAPAILIGFNENLAWTFTTSTSNQFTVYQLTLQDGDPLTYTYDDSTKTMTSQQYTIDVLQEDGTTQQMTRTMYRSHYGPIFMSPDNFLFWSEASAYAIKDATVNYSNFIETFQKINKASSIDEFKSVLSTVGGVPWNNAMVADKEGNVFYTDSTTVPNLSDQAIANYKTALQTDFFTQEFAKFPAILLDGSDSSNEWIEDASATVTGTIPFAEAPQVERTDYVANLNDSYWMPHATEFLPENSLLYGGYETIRSLRTRMGFKMIQDLLSTGDNKISREELKDEVLFSNRSMSAELLKDELVARCEATTTVTLNEEEVDLTEACTLMKNWDGTLNLESVGFAPFREFMGQYSLTREVDESSELFATTFDPTDPVNTPSGLATAPDEGDDPILVKLATAVKSLESVNLDLDANLGVWQFGYVGQNKFSVHGGNGFNDGAFNVSGWSNFYSDLLGKVERGTVVNSSTFLTENGYQINRGPTFMMAVEFTDNGPEAEAILIYSQSRDSASEHFNDQSSLFANKQWRSMLFTDEEIDSDPNLTTMVIEAVE